ncbi:hypothetical protein MARPO_0033s0076 [Marchantia polymorpha]|uniref:Uncharacterized protein n=1 Tax=Marchantia polymorpha TaxID=3197 RepID=A0A2R6X6E8_MARPO|nr:hypothetical protein MARPO_0033s0076 [Marchantia polymorpha]|eukprot:PTQ41667.1 hypothetical protein MARPO_0033s0076 [Marchantia polymorpha]
MSLGFSQSERETGRMCSVHNNQLLKLGVLCFPSGRHERIESTSCRDLRRRTVSRRGTEADRAGTIVNVALVVHQMHPVLPSLSVIQGLSFHHMAATRRRRNKILQYSGHD